MRVFHVHSASVAESGELPQQMPTQGHVWLACTQQELASRLTEIQTALQALCGMQLVDLHVSDLLNPHLPSHFDYTSQYDVLVFRRLAPGSAPSEIAAQATKPARGGLLTRRPRKSGPPILRRIDTNPVGFAVFDRVLLSVHPEDCLVRDAYANRLLQSAAAVPAEIRASGNRLPSSPADLMLRVVNHMVDGFLELRRELTRQLDHWQAELLMPRTRFNNWGALLEARMSLHALDAVCEDQRAAVQDWIEALKTWPEATGATAQRERDLLAVRSRDVLEHIERVVHHVRRLEQSAETAVQMHFSAQGNRTNDIMRTLTVLTAIFLPLNLIAGIFGMNFEFIPLIHTSGGFWWALAAMGFVGVGLALVFWRKRYLEHSSR